MELLLCPKHSCLLACWTQFTDGPSPDNNAEHQLAPLHLQFCTSYPYLTTLLERTYFINCCLSNNVTWRFSLRANVIIVQFNLHPFCSRTHASNSSPVKTSGRFLVPRLTLIVCLQREVLVSVLKYQSESELCKLPPKNNPGPGWTSFKLISDCNSVFVRIHKLWHQWYMHNIWRKSLSLC